ncbi:MAG: hypothetical protein JST16_06095 [Bdellovibrionales bacterium]|nr:hypothetical protein [Bdellovibrionales bacterium]
MSEENFGFSHSGDRWISSPGFSIRPARTDEVQELSALAMRSKAHWPYPPHYLEKCVPALKVDAAYVEQWPVFVAETAERTVGTAFGSPVDSSGVHREVYR